MTVTKTRAAWQGAVHLAALATSEAAAAVLVGMRVDAHPFTDVCAIITDVLKVQWREEAYICVYPVQVAWRCAVELNALAHSEADAAMLVGMLLRRRVHAHPSTDICALATDVIKVE